MRNLTLLSLCLALCLLRTSYANEKLVIFGDSLSDGGRAYAATDGRIPPLPFYGRTYDSSGTPGEVFPGRFTDGQNWVDYLPGVAQLFHVNLQSVTAYLPDTHSATATNFAVGGATSGDDNVIDEALLGFQAQILTYLSSVGTQASPGDLYVIWIGANDFKAGIDPTQTLANIKNGIAELSAKGARKFVVITVPDLSLTPDVKALGGPTISAAKRSVLTTNFLLAVGLPQFALQHRISIDLVDINAIFLPLVYTPGRFGFTNSTDSGLAALAANPSTNPNAYVFWDGFHPTTKAHFFAAEFIFTAVFFQDSFREFLSLR
jgi:phospholipase/lecithinase/hemolysin